MVAGHGRGPGPAPRGAPAPERGRRGRGGAALDSRARRRGRSGCSAQFAARQARARARRTRARLAARPRRPAPAHPAPAGPERPGTPARAARRGAGPPAGRPVRPGGGRGRHPLRRAEARSAGTSSSAWPSARPPRASTASRSHELPDFAARYREVAADLARARTYRADPAIQSRLERLAAAGHNALYRDERSTWRRIWIVLARECPAAVVEARRYVLARLPHASSCRRRPASRCCASGRPSPPSCCRTSCSGGRRPGASRKAAGRGYVDVAPEDRALMASGIITNNVRVAIACFAGGIFLGRGIAGAAGLQRAGDRRLRGPLRQRRAARLPAHLHPGPRGAGAVRHLGGGRGGVPAGALGGGAGTASRARRAGAERPAGGPDGRARRRCCWSWRG